MAEDPGGPEATAHRRADVMARIRDRIREQRGDRGPTTDDEVDELTALKLQAFADEAEIDPDLLARLMARDHNWNIYPTTASRPTAGGCSGRLVVFLKKLVRPFVRLYTDQPLSRQAQINQYLLHLCHHLARDVVRLQLENTALKNRCDALEGQEGDERRLSAGRCRSRRAYRADGQGRVSPSAVAARTPWSARAPAFRRLPRAATSYHVLTTTPWIR